MNDIDIYQSNPHYIFISLHLENFDKEFKHIIQTQNFVGTKDSHRLVQEYLNKLYCTLYSLEYCLKLKDALVMSLISKYIYEIFVDFHYIFENSSLEEKRVEQFFDFEQTPEKHDWTEKNRSERVTAINNSFLTTHKSYYSRLNNNAHPSIHSLFLNRRGMKFEQWFVLSSVLMDISTVILILNHPNTLKYYNFDNKKLDELSKSNSGLLENLNKNTA